MTEEGHGISDDRHHLVSISIPKTSSSRCLGRVSANAIDVRTAANVYARWLDHQGHIIGDCTITGAGEAEFPLGTGDILQSTTPAWLGRQIRDGHQCILTGTYRILPLPDPKSGDILAGIIGADLPTESLPFRASRFLDIGPVPVHAARVTYIGEFGSEPHIPAEYSHIVDSLRPEKSYHDFAVGIDNTETPPQASRGFVGAFLKPDFIGRNVSYIRAGGFGPTLGALVGRGGVEPPDGITKDMLRRHRWDIDVHDTRVAATRSLTPYHDPKGDRARH